MVCCSISGGGEAGLIEGLAQLGNEVQRLAAREADTQTLGLVRLTDAQSVTADKGLALPASQNNAALPGTLAHRVEEVGRKIAKRSLLYSNAGTIAENAELDLSSADYHLLEVHWAFNPSTQPERVSVFPKGANISLWISNASEQSDVNTFIGSRVYIYESDVKYKAGKGCLRRFNGAYGCNDVWFTILKIYGIQYSG